MRRQFLLRMVVLVVLVACSDDDTRSLGPAPTAPATTTVPVTTTVAPTTTAPTTTVRPAITTTATGPRLVNGIPQSADYLCTSGTKTVTFHRT